MTTLVVLGARGELGMRVVRLLRAHAPEAELRLAARGGTRDPYKLHARRGGANAHAEDQRARQGVADARARDGADDGARDGAGGRADNHANHRAGGRADSETVRASDLYGVDAEDGAALRALLRGAACVVNCMGPFDHAPDALVEAAVARGCHYADLAESADYSAAVARAAEACDAKGAGVAVVTGCSTLPGLVEMLARELVLDCAPREPVAFDAYLSMASRSRPTRALLTGLLRPLGRAGPRGAWFGELATLRVLGGRKLVCGSTPAGALEAGLALPSPHTTPTPPVPLRFWAGFDRALLTRALHWAAPALGRASPARIPKLAAWLLPFAHLARVMGGTHGVLAVVARDAQGEEIARAEVHAGAPSSRAPASPDAPPRAAGLDIPAAPALWLAARLLREHGLPGGVQRLDQLVAWADAREWLEAAGCAVHFSSEEEHA